MSKIVVIGSSNTDMVIGSEKMPAPGETVLGNEFDVIQGGKGANQAVAAARAGADVAFVAKVGDDDFGKNAIAGYKQDRIDTSSVFIDSENKTGIAVIIVEEGTGQNSIVVAPGANGNLKKQEIDSIKHIIESADIVLLQLEIPLSVVEHILGICREFHVMTVLNPAPAQKLSDELLRKVAIITPNETETSLITGMDIDSPESLEKAANQLLEKVGDTVIITLGEKGVYFVTKSGQKGMLPAETVQAVDTTAAGDVFNGYLVAGLANKMEMVDAIKLAIKAASISVTKKGAQPSIPTIEDC